MLRQCISIEFTVRICYIHILQCIQSTGQWPRYYIHYKAMFQFIYITSNITMCSIERKTVPNRQGSGPNITNLICSISRTVFQLTWQWPNGICVYNVTTLKGDNLPLLWYLGKLKLWRKSSVLWNFSYPDHTHTLRLVLTLGTPRAYPAYPTA